ncbi:MAG: hypothetical protein A4S16_04085 [Proteobacteria bacterium SG_bin6]|nr:MAG: hypothetical protein A4S16_04085 [Proteobacteria bacterium SG_bin6]
MSAQPAVKALACPNCGGTVSLRAAGYTVTVACEYCGSLLDVSQGEVRLLQRYQQAVGRLAIPLGTRGRIDGIEWEAIGHLDRSEGGSYPWEEYLLFNPYHGYRWLMWDGRGWSFGEMLTQTPSHDGGGLRVGDTRFERFFVGGRAQVDAVVGEFYWRVKRGERVKSDSWVAPGLMLSREENEQEVSWTVLRLLTAAEAEAAFGVAAPRDPWPPLPHQPSPYRGAIAPIGWIAAASLLFTFVAMIVLSGGRTLARATLPIAADGREQSATIGPVTLHAPWQQVQIRARVPAVDNGWVDLDYALVDRKTQARYEAGAAAERYHGVDSDGSWSEGSGGARVSVASVPAGSYDLVVDYKGNRWSDTSQVIGTFGQDWRLAGQPQVELEAVSGGALFGNWLLAALLIALPFGWFLFRHIRFEQARQDQSDVGRTGLAAMFTSNSDDD